jgi:hypothetical protein
MTDHIIITDGSDTLHLLPEIEFEIVPVEVSHTATMASGREVRDWIGYRNTLTIPTGWLSAEDLAKLKRMILASHMLTVTYPTPEGDAVGEFSMPLPAMRAFKYGPDGSVWYGVTLTMSETEVHTE